MRLIKNIIALVTEYVHELAQWIEQEYEIDANEIITKWIEIISNFEYTKAKLVGQRDPAFCQHVFRSGANKDMQCTVKPKEGTLCSTHKPKPARLRSGVEKSVDLKDGQLDPVYCAFSVSEGKQCGTKPKNGAPLCSIHKNGAPKIKVVPLVNGELNAAFCNHRIGDNQCGVKPRSGNYCSNHDTFYNLA
jgi:hypothetical protein